MLRQPVYTDKQIISTSKTQSLDFKHGAANVTYIHKFSDILICKSACEKLIWVQMSWNRERSDTYPNRRFPKCITCMHVPLWVVCIHQKHSDSNFSAQQPIWRLQVLCWVLSLNSLDGEQRKVQDSVHQTPQTFCSYLGIYLPVFSVCL